MDIPCWLYPYSSAYGSKTVSTPAFDFVAKKGCMFTNAYALSKAEVPAFLPNMDIVKGDILDYAVEIEWFDKQLMPVEYSGISIRRALFRILFKCGIKSAIIAKAGLFGNSNQIYIIRLSAVY